MEGNTPVANFAVYDSDGPGSESVENSASPDSAHAVAPQNTLACGRAHEATSGPADYEEEAKGNSSWPVEETKDNGPLVEETVANGPCEAEAVNNAAAPVTSVANESASAGSAHAVVPQDGPVAVSHSNNERVPVSTIAANEQSCRTQV